MHFLNEDESWTLFRKNVFGENSFPPEFETTGKNICRNCRGIALSIIVIAGLLSKATKTHHEWEKIAENISSVVTSNDEQCSKVLHLSYKNLPHHLKCCYLYMGIFPEDFNIPVSTLFKLWITEGFVKSMGSKNFEDVAEEYLLDLVHRSLVMVSKESSRVNLRYINAGCVEGWYLASIDKLRNLQTIILHSYGKSFELPQQIWKMQQLRHVQLGMHTTFPCPPKARVKGEISVIVLENLQTLSVLENFRCTEAMLKRIPNLKKLGVLYSDPPEAPLDWGL
ncbi:late blight resistance homolog R1A-10 [Olea europaea subsp. europaea]|uniref:Late blight resistance homolog R1A-10 n=1 Tax=Olea europaea subsp. europaea TaxID=158383 RepID=A0A8S0U0G4_OLEEU|nr:late blight resistance homolog R1A-10 [Olea europaea subsp. europaea]